MATTTTLFVSQPTNGWVTTFDTTSDIPDVLIEREAQRLMTEAYFSGDVTMAARKCAAEFNIEVSMWESPGDGNFGHRFFSKASFGL